jgi:hypothetical protein
MRFGAVVAGVAVAIGSMYGVVWVVQRVVHGTPGISSKSEVTSTLEVATGSLRPKAVVEETEHQFGTMEVGEERTHAFIVRNEGQGPLKLEKGPTTCQCTISDVPNGEIPPGGTAEIVLTWKPTAETEEFNKGATIITNEPNEKGENRKIELTITGIVSARLRISPTGDWTITNMRDYDPTEYVGTLFSPVLDSFNIVSIDSGSPHVTATVEPMSDAVREENKAKSGYSIRVVVAPSIPVGPFNIPLTLKTDVPQRLPEAEGDGKGKPESKPESIPSTEIKVVLRGHRRGPVRMLGREWIDEKMVASMGGFSHQTGKKIMLSMLVTGVPAEGLKLEQPETEPSLLKVSFEPQEDFKGEAKMYHVHLEVPPNSPIMNRTADHLARVKVRSNHPRAPEIMFDVSFHAY